NTLPVGTHSIIGVYSGNSSFKPSQGTLTSFIVTQGSTTTVLTAAPSGTAVFGQPVTFTATVSPVSPSTATPTGANGATVSFYNNSLTAGNLLASNPVSSSGVGTLNINTLPVGSHNIIAVYSGDSNYKPSQNTVSNFIITQGTTTTAVTAAPSGSAVFGQP